MRRTTGEECETLFVKAQDKPVSSGGKRTSDSWMAAQRLKDGTTKCGYTEVLTSEPLCPWLVHLVR